VVSLFSDRGTLSLRDASEHWNQQQRSKAYHTHVTHRAAMHELASKAASRMPGGNQQRIKTSVFSIRRLVKSDESRVLKTNEFGARPHKTEARWTRSPSRFSGVRRECV
jgi:hypothetical protein